LQVGHSSMIVALAVLPLAGKRGGVSDLLRATSHWVRLTASDDDWLEALRTRVTAAVLSAVQRDDEVRVGVDFSAGTEAGSIEGSSTGEVPLDRGSSGEGGNEGGGDGSEEHFV
jgi:hypothetical protein